MAMKSTFMNKSNVYIFKSYFINPLHRPHSSQCSTTGVTKAVVCVILSVG